MTLTKIQLAPGIVSDTTRYSNSGGWFDSNLIRFRGGLPEKIGGWIRAYTNQTPMIGICRKMVAWSDINGNTYTALPTEKLFYADNSANIIDISPVRRTLTLGTNPLGTTSGSSKVTVTDVNHGAQVGDYVVISGASTTGGIASTYINAQLIVTDVLDNNRYQVETNNAATSTATGGGSSVVVGYLYYSASSVTSSVSGWGAGAWGGAENPSKTFIIDNAITTNTATNTTVGGLAKTTVTITTPTAHGSSAGDSVLMTGLSAVGGLTVANLQKALAIITTPTSTTFTVQVEGTATSSVTGGGTGATLQIYGSNSYGWGDTPDVTLTASFTGLWSVDNYGEDMIACPRDMTMPTILGANPAATTSGSNVVVVTQVGHGYATGDAVILTGLTSFNGIDALYLNGSFTVTRLTADTYSYVASVNATGTGSGGGALAYSYVCPLVYWDTSADTRAKSFSRLGSAYAKKFMPYSVTEVLTSDINRHVIAFGTNPFDTTKGIDRMLIRFSDSNDPTNWDASDTTKTAGELRCSAGSYIVTAIQNREEILVWTDIALYTMNYVGAPYTYGLQLVGTGFDIIGPNSKAVAGSTAYWMGYNNFYSYNGRVESMPCPVRDYVFLDINRDQGNKVHCGTDTGNNEIIWFYASAGSEENDRYVVYNYAENVWYYGQMCRSAWLDRGAYTKPRAVCTSGYLFQHDTGYDDGSTTPPTPLNAYIESSPIEIEQGDRFGFVSRIIPDLTFRDTDLSILPEPVVKFIVKPQNTPGGATLSGDTRNAQRSPAATLQVNRFTEQLFTRIRGRSIVLRIESDELGVGWRMGAPRLDIKPDGRK